MGGYSAVQAGDCVVAFSRRDIYAIKQFIEQETKHRACVVYGALPPETRRQQAKLFNEQGERLGQWVELAGYPLQFMALDQQLSSSASAVPNQPRRLPGTAPPPCGTDNAYRVLVASDAVGMGLNLNIRRVIFHSVAKREGEAGSVRRFGLCCSALHCMLTVIVMLWHRLPLRQCPRGKRCCPASAAAACFAGGSTLVPVSTSMMKQIAGRAGRRSSQWPNGLATCRNASDVARLQEALAVRMGTAAVLLPCPTCSCSQPSYVLCMLC